MCLCICNVLDMVLEVDEELKGPIRGMQGPFPNYIAIAAVLRAI